MPIVHTKKAMNELKPGEVIEVQATDKGALADLKAWAKDEHQIPAMDPGAADSRHSD